MNTQTDYKDLVFGSNKLMHEAINWCMRQTTSWWILSDNICLLVMIMVTVRSCTFGIQIRN